jgi:hypothetical protein
MVCESQRRICRIYRHYPEFDSVENVMQFRLTYEGELRSCGNNNRNTENKHRLRKAFHPQLKHLWETNATLGGLATIPAHMLDKPFGGMWKAQPHEVSYIQMVAANRPLKDYNFVPLVTEELALWCGLEILYLRPGPVVDAGDVDNRIKTIFDALKRPSQLHELGNYQPPTEFEKPFYVLLDDDKFISKLSVEADSMLEPLVGGIPNDNDARLIITVTIRPSIVTFRNAPFAG